MYLSLYCKGSKRVTQGFTVRGSWRPNKDCNILTPLLWPSVLCLSRSPGLLNRRPRGSAFCWVLAFSTTSCHQQVSKTPSGVPRAPSPRNGFPYHNLSATSLDPNSSGAPRAPSAGLSLPHLISNFSGPQLNRGTRGTPTQSGDPSAWCGFPYHILSPIPKLHRGPEGPFGRVWLSLPHLVSDVSDPQLIRGPNSIWLPVLTELYNSSTPTQLPTQSLEWHVWSSSSGNNCHAVQRSLSSGASVYECIMGFLPCPISSAKSAHAISFDYWPLECVTSFRCITLNGIFGRVEGQNTTVRHIWMCFCCLKELDEYDIGIWWEINNLPVVPNEFCLLAF